jgi:hypothetical protein
VCHRGNLAKQTEGRPPAGHQWPTLAAANPVAASAAFLLNSFQSVLGTFARIPTLQAADMTFSHSLLLNLSPNGVGITTSVGRWEGIQVCTWLFFFTLN